MPDWFSDDSPKKGDRNIGKDAAGDAKGSRSSSSSLKPLPALKAVARPPGRDDRAGSGSVARESVDAAGPKVGCGVGIDVPVDVAVFTAAVELVWRVGGKPSVLCVGAFFRADSGGGGGPARLNIVGAGGRRSRRRVLF